MSSAELLEEIERLTKRVEELEKTENDAMVATPSSSLNMPVVQVNNQKAKTDSYSGGLWNEWISHFKLCAQINNWDDTQCCQQLAVSLHGRAQQIYLMLQDDEKMCFKDLVNALQSRIQPDQQRKIHKLTHDIPSAGHFGSQRLKEVIKRRFYWNDWQSDVEMHCKNCRICAERNGPSRKRCRMMVLDEPGYQWNMLLWTSLAHYVTPRW